MAQYKETPFDQPTSSKIIEIEENKKKQEENEIKHNFMDVNLFSTKKAVTQGMLNFSLLASNFSELKYLLHEEVDLSFYIAIICLISSILLQIAVGIILLVSSTYNINSPDQQKTAELLNNLAGIGTFLITVVNIASSIFTDSDDP